MPDALARHVERPADLVQRPRVLAVQPIPKLEDASLALRELAEDLLQRLLAQRDLRGVLGQQNRLVGDEVPELGLLGVADRLLERDRGLRRATDLVDLRGCQLEVLRDLQRDRLAAE